MTPKEYARAAAHHDLEIDLKRDAWLQGQRGNNMNDEQRDLDRDVHTCGGPVFGRKTPGCPRCDALLAGAAPRQSWGRASRYDGYTTFKHSCQESNCAPICTYGDW